MADPEIFLRIRTLNPHSFKIANKALSGDIDFEARDKFEHLRKDPDLFKYVNRIPQPRIPTYNTFLIIPSPSKCEWHPALWPIQWDLVTPCCPTHPPSPPPSATVSAPSPCCCSPLCWAHPGLVLAPLPWGVRACVCLCISVRLCAIFLLHSGGRINQCHGRGKLT